MDCYTRFAGPDLLFLAWQQDDSHYCERAATLEHQLKETLPTLKTVRLPVCMNGEMFNSPLNWIQLDDLLLVPDFPGTPLAAKAAITKMLQSHGFRVVYIDSPTTDSGDALQCLTASVFKDLILRDRAESCVTVEPRKLTLLKIEKKKFYVYVLDINRHDYTKKWNEKL